MTVGLLTAIMTAGSPPLSGWRSTSTNLFQECTKTRGPVFLTGFHGHEKHRNRERHGKDSSSDASSSRGERQAKLIGNSLDDLEVRVNASQWRTENI